MATDAELRLILRANDQASAALDKVQGRLSGVGKTAADIGKRFGGGQLFGSILSGVGLGSGMQLMQKAVDLISKGSKEAADAAVLLEKNSAEALAHTQKMLEIRRKMLGITKEEDLGLLESQVRDARAAYDEVSRPRFVEGSTLSGAPNGVVSQRETTKQEAEDIIAAARTLRALQDRLDEARLAEQEKGQAEILASVKKFSADYQKTIEIQQKKDDQRRKANASAAAAIAEQGSNVREAEELLTEFFDSVEKGAQMLADKRLDERLRDFFYTIDNAQPGAPSSLDRAREGASFARSPGGSGSGIELGLQSTVAGLGTTAEQVAGTIQNTLGSAVFSISDGIAGWASGMMSFGDAANQIWTNFKMAALQAFTDMVAQYAVKKAAMFAIDVLFSAKGLALQLASAAKSLIAWIPSAIAASISSFGTAALVGAAAVAAVIAATGGFADGGLVTGPGSGTSDSILARISNGEYIVPAAAVQRIGERNLDAMASGAASPASAMASGGGGMGGRGATILVDSRREADRFRRGSPMETQIVQVMQANRYRVAHT